MGRLLLTVAVILVVLAAIVGVNTWRHNSRQLGVPTVTPVVVDSPTAATHLIETVRARTVLSATDTRLSADQFRQLCVMLETRYPKTHAVLQREQMGDFALLYTWKGADPSLKPTILTTHQNVMPIASDTKGDQTQPPFDGVVKDGMVWGHGAWDDKDSLILQVEAIELLAASGPKPRHTIHLASGADEEMGGERGAKRVVALLKSRGEHLDFVIDESLLVAESVLPGLARPTALIDVTEKGFPFMQLKVGTTSEHSSMPSPPGQSVVAMMNATLKRLDDDRLSADIRDVTREMFATLVPEMQGFSRMTLSNLWLFGPLLQKQLEASGSSNAVLRTATTLTIVQAGNKDSMPPGYAEATVSFRLLLSDIIASIAMRVKDAAKAAAPRGEFELTRLSGSSEASPMSPTQSASYQLINETVRELFPGTVVTSGLMTGATDSHHMIEIVNYVYRFSPMRAKLENLPRLHGTDERITETSLVELVRFYHRLVQQAAGA